MRLRTVFITGINSGIGGALAQGFLQSGWQVIGTVRDPDKALPYTVEEDAALLILPLEVTDDASVARLPMQLNDRGIQTIDALVNNAGIVVHGPLECISAAQLRYQMEVNVTGVLQVTNALLPLLRQNAALHGRAHILNLSSVSGLFAFPYLGPYSASKFALEALSDAYRRELKNFGIHVVKIQAGAIQTPIWHKALNNIVPLDGTHYAALAPVIQRSIKGSEKHALPLESIVRLVLKICTQARPKPAYLLARNAALFRWVPFVPVRWIDAMIARYFKRLVQNTRPE